MTLAIMSGEMSFGFVNPVSLPFIREGKLRPLAITSVTRSPQLPDVPTVAEEGLPGYETGSWFGLMTPKGTPEAIIEKIRADVHEVLAQPEIVRRLQSVDAVPSPNSPAEFAKEIRTELEKWRVLIRKLNITIE
jgi:tripartite-type tricarboxylate transporter receptor subunit TctC